MLAYCQPSSEWVPGDNTGEIKVVRKEITHPTSYADGPGQVSSLTGTPLRMKAYGTSYTLSVY